MNKVKLILIGILMILFISINCSCSSKQIYYYDDFAYSCLDNGSGTNVKLTLSRNNTFSIFTSNIESDSIRIKGNLERIKDTIFLKYNRKPYKPDIKLECNDSIRSVQLQIFIDDDRILFEDTFLKVFVNDTLYDGSNLKINKNKTYNIRVMYAVNLIGECFKVRVGKCNVIKLRLQKYGEKTYEYPILSMDKFLKKGNKLYPIFDCSNQTLYKDVYLLRNKKREPDRKMSMDGIWHPSISLFDRY